jgi:peptidyl-prolyl cis-trans isomerase B (cyclophilin B)
MKLVRLAGFTSLILLAGLACVKVVQLSIPDTYNLSAKERVGLALRVKSNPVKLTGNECAVVETNKGSFTFELYSNDAPNTVRNFIRLADAGFYDGLIWHRYEPGFVIQGGDPLGTGYGGPGYTVDYEESGRSHIKGAVGMARGPDRNSASCQFYICLEPAPNLDGNYCVFGQVIEGMDVVMQLRNGNEEKGIPPDTIRSITITH